jgi:hypothetical protein
VVHGLSVVMPGLDPGIHTERNEEWPRNGLRLRQLIMDCRVKPGNDRVGRLRQKSSADQRYFSP